MTFVVWFLAFCFEASRFSSIKGLVLNPDSNAYGSPSSSHSRAPLKEPVLIT